MLEAGHDVLLYSLQELSTDELCQVQAAPKNSLYRQYCKQFEMSQTHLHITPKAMQAISVIAKEKGTGARGLRSILERLLVDAMFEVSPAPYSEKRPAVHLSTNRAAPPAASTCVI